MNNEFTIKFLDLTRYFQERLLYRLSVSEYKDRFILKGGALLYAHYGFQARPTLEKEYHGIRVSFVALLDTAQQCISMDVGFGDDPDILGEAIKATFANRDTKSKIPIPPWSSLSLTNVSTGKYGGSNSQ